MTAAGPDSGGSPTAFTVYVHERGKKPRVVGTHPAGRIKSTIELDGMTYYWVSGDISERTLTYSNFKPAAVLT